MNTPRIFVQIASYRDAECAWTVRDLLAKATHPERITIGICWQYDPENEPATFSDPACPPEQLRVVSYTLQETLGGSGWARSTAQSLVRDEEYTLQIDAHMRFVEGWDEKLIAMLAACPHEDVALSTCPPGYRPPDKLTDCAGNVPFTTAHSIGTGNDPQLLHLRGGLSHRAERKEKPFLSAFMIGNFMFAKSSIFERVPIDPYIYFFCDEVMYSARLWTHGIDIYQPNEVILYHQWVREQRGVNLRYKDIRAELNTITRARGLHIFGITETNDPRSLKEIDRYGLGTARDIEDFWRFSGVNLRTGHVEDFAKNGRWQQKIP